MTFVVVVVAAAAATEDNAVSFGLRDMTRRFCDCLGR